MSAQQLTVTGRATAGGLLTLKLPAFAVGVTRTVSQITVSNGSAATNVTQLTQVYLNQVLDSATRSNPDTATGVITLRASDELMVQFVGLDASVIGTVTFTYDDVKAA